MTDNVLPPEQSNDRSEKSAKQKRKTLVHIKEPKEFDTQEVKPSQGDDTKVEEGGTIDLGRRLDPLETFERYQILRTRTFITYTVLLLSAIWFLSSLIYYLKTGNSFLISTTPPMSGPVLIILGYYFGEQLLYKYIHRGP